MGKIDQAKCTSYFFTDPMGVPVEIRRISRVANNRLRDEAMFALHEIQLENLVKWRNTAEASEQEREQLLIQLLVLVNAISGGLKSTG